MICASLSYFLWNETILTAIILSDKCMVTDVKVTQQVILVLYSDKEIVLCNAHYLGTRATCNTLFSNVLAGHKFMWHPLFDVGDELSGSVGFLGIVFFHCISTPVVNTSHASNTTYQLDIFYLILVKEGMTLILKECICFTDLFIY